MTISISNSYVLKFSLKDNPQYAWSKCGKCFNIKTGREIRKVICGRSVGYCINGGFKSLNTLRKQLVKIEDTKCPF